MKVKEVHFLKKNIRDIGLRESPNVLHVFNEKNNFFATCLNVYFYKHFKFLIVNKYYMTI